MKFKLIFAIVLFFFSQIFSQTKLFENIKNENTDSLKIIGMYYNWDQSKTYEKYNFYLTDKETIDSLINNTYYSEATNNIGEQNNFDIIVTKNNQIMDRWSVNPKFENINIKGQFHKFHIETLVKLAKKHPLKYNWYIQDFRNKEEFEKFYSNKIIDSNTLFIYKPNFVYDGSFEIQFPKNEIFNSPKAIDDYLRPKIERISKDEKFGISYIFNEYNRKNRDQYTMTISGSKNLFIKLNEPQGKKGSWKPTKLESQIFEKIE